MKENSYDSKCHALTFHSGILWATWHIRTAALSPLHFHGWDPDGIVLHDFFWVSSGLSSAGTLA